MIEDLQALVAVVETKSLTKASARLCVTQSAVSRRLQHLEEVLGASLLDRAQRPPVPTALGMRVYERALPVLHGIADLVAMLKEEADPIGVMRLGMAQGISDLMLAETVERLQTLYPRLDLRLRTDWSGGLCQQVANGALDAALVLLPASSPPPAGIAGRCLGSVQTAIVQDGRRARFRRPIKLIHLAKENWVLNPLGCGYRAALEAAMGARNGALHVAIDTYGVDVQLRMVAAGRGLGLVPRSALTASPISEGVAIIDVTDFSLSLDAWLLEQRQQGDLRRPLGAVAAVVSARLKEHV